jgi:hypothetical protein
LGTLFTTSDHPEDPFSSSAVIAEIRGEVASRIVADRHRFACSTIAGELVVVSNEGQPVLRLGDALPNIPPLLAGDRMLYATKNALKLVELDAPEKPVKIWLKTDWLGGVTTAPILIDSRVYFGTANKGLVCAAARN